MIYIDNLIANFAAYVGKNCRNVTSGAALSSLKELFRIVTYFDLPPAEFFAPLEPGGHARRAAALSPGQHCL